ncbi:MAG: LamG domain-containing protein [Phycisphaerae bacterium]
MRQPVTICILAVWASSVSAAKLPIIAHWSFDKDQGTTTLLDSGANKLDVPLVPADTGEKVKTVKGIVGQALELTGKEKAVFSLTNKKLNIKAPFTIACWVRIKNAIQADNSIFINTSRTGKDGYRLFVNWRMFFYRWGDGTQINSTYASILLDKWYHLAVTNDGKTKKIYVNGSLDKSEKSDNSQPAVNYESCGIGNYFGTERNRFIGLMDELCILGKALSDDEVFDLAAKQD